MRLFVGIPLDHIAREALADVTTTLMRRLPGLRWSSPGSWHITLQFLGNVSDLTASAISMHLANIRGPAIPLRIGKLGFFDRAGILYADIDLSAELTDLNQRVVSEMSSLGFRPETRPYMPHITLARTRGRTIPVRLLGQCRLGAQFVADQFILYESFTGPQGARYVELKSYPLAC